LWPARQEGLFYVLCIFIVCDIYSANLIYRGGNLFITGVNNEMYIMCVAHAYKRYVRYK